MREQQLTDWQKDYIKTHVDRNKTFDAYQFYVDYMNFVFGSYNADWYDDDLYNCPNIVSFLKSIGISIPKKQINCKLSNILGLQQDYGEYSGKEILINLGDCYDVFPCDLGWYYASDYVPKKLPQSWEQPFQQHVLDELGLTWEQFYQIVVEEDYNDELEELADKLDIDKVKSEIVGAYQEAESICAQDNFYSTLSNEVTYSLGNIGCSIINQDWVDGDINLTIMIDDFEKFNNSITNLIFDMPVSYDEVEILRHCLAEELSIHQPYLGWWDFQEDVFLDILCSNLSSID